MQQLVALIERHKAGEPVGVFSVCSAHLWMIRAAMAQAVRCGEPVLIEATSSQVNQFGGYTGMTPAQFRDAVWRQADECGLPRQRVWLGGDHLGPNAWQDRPTSAAMALAMTLIDDYVAAGFRKIHLDCSMRCQDDPARLDDEQVSQRAARLCAVAERRWRRDGGEPPVYIIGTKVPVPGGAHEALDGLAVTSPQAVAQTLNTQHQAWRAAGLETVWSRVIGLVVQPGVEFDHQSVERYRPERAAALSRFIEQWPHLVYEAHSTDYQSPQAYRQLVRDHFAILKVGPALTYALREALFALDRIEREWRGERRVAHLCATLEQVMGDHPGYWQRYYPSTPQQQWLHRRYSLSDRVRYYWPRPEVAQAVEALLDNLRAHPAPMTLLSQYLPAQARALAVGQLSADPLDGIMHKIGEVLTDYADTCQFSSRSPIHD